MKYNDDTNRLLWFESVKADDFKKINEDGLDYSDAEVRVANVHSRQDIMLLCWDAAMHTRYLRKIYKQLICINIILSFIALIIFAT
jgi:hypothetical protein